MRICLIRTMSFEHRPCVLFVRWRERKWANHWRELWWNCNARSLIEKSSSTCRSKYIVRSSFPVLSHPLDSVRPAWSFGRFEKSDSSSEKSFLKLLSAPAGKALLRRKFQQETDEPRWCIIRFFFQFHTYTPTVIKMESRKYNTRARACLSHSGLKHITHFFCVIFEKNASDSRAKALRARGAQLRMHRLLLFSPCRIMQE